MRDPFLVADALKRAGVPCPAVRESARGLPRDGSWLWKPRSSAGGRRIRPVRPGDDPLSVPHYVQERIAGVPLSAIWIGQEGEATLVGVTWQWTGRPGSPFVYRGSIGPWPLAPEERARMAALGGAVAGAFRLTGLFGIDLILRDGIPWPVEINPRYTASVEVLELALGRALLAEHRAACEREAPPAPLPSSPRRRGVVGKLILYARHPGRFPGSYRWRPPDLSGFRVPTVADVPEPGTPFHEGEPVLTLLARAPSVARCRERLLRKQAVWERKLWNALDPGKLEEGL